MHQTNNQSGFTLLELVVSFTIIALIAGLTMGGMRLGILTRESGENRANIYQRLRFIREQISQKIKSNHPLFIKAPSSTDDIFLETEALETDQGLQQDSKFNTNEKYIAFTGKNDSIHFITFANGLSNFKKKPWAHEVLIYQGLNPITNENGIVMMERDIFVEDSFSEINPNSEAVTYFMLAKEVAFLKFRYYKMEKYTSEELEKNENKTELFYGEWVEEVVSKPIENFAKEFGSEDDVAIFRSENKISLPRAIEISLGLKFPSPPGEPESNKIYYIPPTIVTLNSGVLLSRPIKENDKI